MPFVRCGKLIDRDEEWQLDHADDGRGWLGPAHQRCNARAGWARMVETVNRNGAGLIEESPCPWSRRWCQDPPVGTEVYLGGGLVEVHVGRGIWRPVD